MCPVIRVRLAGAPIEILDGVATPRSAALARAQRPDEKELARVLDEELYAARLALWEAFPTMRRYALFASTELRQVVEHAAEAPTPPRIRTSDIKRIEQHLFLVLQRIATKNETFSEFGPFCWGRFSPDEAGVRTSDIAVVEPRIVFVERRAVEQIIASINQDPDVRIEVSPRVHPCGELVGNRFVRYDLGTETELESAAVDLLRRCDGVTPAHALGDRARLEALATSGVVIWEVEPVTYVRRRLACLHDDISRWRDGAARARWLAVIDRLSRVEHEFARTAPLAERRKLLDDGAAILDELTTAARAPAFKLFAATNVIGENCHTPIKLHVASEIGERVCTDAAPWIDLFRDAAGFVTDAVNRKLVPLFESAPTKLLPAFLRHCEQQGYPLAGGQSALAATARGAFAEIEQAFRAQIADRSSQDEIALEPADCDVVAKLGGRAFRDYSYPSADIMISATSEDAVARGDYQIVLAELHPYFALILAAGLSDCDDADELARGFAAVAGSSRTSDWSVPPFQGGHMHPCWSELMPEQFRAIVPDRVASNVPSVRPADVEVRLDDTGNLELHHTRTGEDLGSLARNGFTLFYSMHPFLFSSPPHTPRLRCGRVIVQRRSWLVLLDDLTRKFTGVSPALLIEIERLRARHGWPRHVFVRASAATARARGVRLGGMDLKPIYIDLESYPFVEIFYHRLKRYGGLEIAEMLPTPDHIPWRDREGGRTAFELRTLLGPAVS